MKTYHALFAFALWLALVVTAPATTYYVNANSADPVSPYTGWNTAATNIQDAVNAAGSISGTVLLVTNGIYQFGGGSGDGFNRVELVAPNFLIQSVNGPAVTIIKGFQMPGTTNGINAVRGVFLTPGSILSGFTVTGGATTSVNNPGGGVFCTSTTAVITNCVITGNASAGNGAGVSGGIIYNSVIAGNNTPLQGGGAFQSVLNHCVISNNIATSGGGVALCSAYDSLLAGNGTTNNTSGGAAYLSTLNDCTLVKNFWSGNGAANACTLTNSIIYYNNLTGSSSDCYQCRLVNCCTTIGLGNTTLSSGSFTNPPGFVDLAGGNYRLQTGSPCIDAGTNAAETNNVDLDGNPRFAGAAVDLGAYENQNTNTVHYVSLASLNPLAPYTNWLTAATNLQAAISIAQPGDVVAANAGVYTNDSVVIFGAETNRVAVTNGVTLLAVYGPASTFIVGATKPGAPMWTAIRSSAVSPSPMAMPVSAAT